jgi:hypothetical protein
MNKRRRRHGAQRRRARLAAWKLAHDNWDPGESFPPVGGCSTYDDLNDAIHRENAGEWH